MSDWENHIDAILAHEQRQGRGGNIVKDDYSQLSPPESATWTGARYQLALYRSGRMEWIELREFRQTKLWGVPRTMRVIVLTENDPLNLQSRVATFASLDTN